MDNAFFETSWDRDEILEGWDEADGCLVSDRVIMDGLPVGYMYRIMPEGVTTFVKYDSGWRFFSEVDDEEYVKNPDAIGIYRLKTICRHCPDILPLLKAPYGTAYRRDKDGKFQEEIFEPLEEEGWDLFENEY
ncbi:DUF2185 domain-containing protein [Bacteroides cellulosilyticus]|uniref:DUF2185 domain-containing protein n=1 Tax=Bacteroides cellulosilyticus TaxID=246787 RepID=UPI0032EE9127